MVVVGGIAMLVGAIDPMEGSLLILPGSGFFAIGTFLGQSERRMIVYRVWVFVLIAIGVGALWGLSMIGGMGFIRSFTLVGGADAALSSWLVDGYLGAGVSAWMLWLGIGVGLWYLTIFAIALTKSAFVWQTLSSPSSVC